MKTMQAEYKTDIALLARQMKDDVSRVAEDAARRDAEAVKRDAEAARREVRLTLLFVGLLVAAVTILGVLIRIP